MIEFMKILTFLRSCIVLLCMTFFMFNQAKGQVTLTTSPYTENFDGVGTTLPTGWSVRTGANATTLGTVATFSTTATAWNTTNSGFRNSASATGLTGAATATEQNNATNRCIGLKQTGSFGDPGAAFVLQLANTLNLTNFQMSFQLQSLDNSASVTRTTTWAVDYGIGATPTTFTPVTPTGTLTTGNVTFSNNLINVNFGTALDNQNSNVWIRIVALTSATGSGSRATTGIDDINLTWSSGGGVASLVANPTTIPDFGNVNNGSTSTASSYTLTATNVTNDVIVTAPANFQVAKGIAGTYSNTITYTAAELANVQTVGVRFVPTSGSNGAKTGNITHSGFGGTNVAVSGTETGNAVVPTLTPSLSTIPVFSTIGTNTNSNSSTYTLTASNLTNDVVVTAPANFQVAKTATGVYGNSITYTPAELTTAQTIGVRFLPTSGTPGLKTGNITHTSTGATTQNVAVSGTENLTNTLPHLQPFNYTAGQPLQTQTGFVALNTGDDINIVADNLSYTDLPTSTGNKISFAGAGIDTYFDFTPQNANTTYSSFLLKISDFTGVTSTSGAYFAGFVSGNGTTSFGGTVWVKKDGAGYQIGLNPRTTAANTVFTTGTPYTLNSTYLVVVSYTINTSSTADDVVKLWVNPTLGQITEPTPLLEATQSVANSDLESIARFLIRQDAATSTPAIEMDEVRVGTTWASVTPLAIAGSPEINLKLSGISIPNNTSLSSIPIPFNTYNATFTIENLGTANLTLGTITFSGANGAEATITTAPTSPVAANGTTTFVVSYTPTSVGAKTVIFNLPNNDSDENPYVVTMNFNVIAPVIAVSQNTTNIPHNNSPAFNMGSTVIGNNLDVTFTITNTGNSNLTLNTPISITGTGYSILTQPTSPVASGANNTTTFVVRYNSASVTSNATGQVTIGNNSANQTNYVINLSASATAAPAPTIAVSQGTNNISNNNSPAFNVGSVNVGSSNTTTFTITNSGTANLSITTPLSVTGSAFSVTTQPATSVGFTPPNNTTTFVVTFTPTTAGAVSGSVTIANGTGTNFVINLTGTGNVVVTPTITTSVNTLTNFGSIQTNQASAIQTYTLSGSNLTNNVVVNAPTNWDISKDGTTFTNQLTYTTTELATAQTVRVRFRPTSNVLGVKTGNITHTSTGAATVNVAVTGTEAQANALENYSHDFIVSPNPAETFINIQCDKPTLWQKANITFYNLEGKSTSNFVWNDASQSLKIDITSWNRGFYILNIVEGNKIATKKILVK